MDYALLAMNSGGSRNLSNSSPLIPFPLFPLLSHSLLHFPSLPLRSEPLLIQLECMGERCKLPQRGLGQSPGRKSNFGIFGAQEMHLLARI